jgi:hypothetical protein
MNEMKGPMIQGPLFEVTVTEYERGWGQRLCPDETRIFTNRQDAEAYARTRNFRYGRDLLASRHQAVWLIRSRR